MRWQSFAANCSSSGDVELHKKITDRLWSVAAKGDDARTLLLRILDQDRLGHPQ